MGVEITAPQAVPLDRLNQLLAELGERGELTARLYDALPIMQWEDQARLGLRHGFGSPWLRIGAVKGFADGSVGSSNSS